MAPDQNDKRGKRIPIRFVDATESDSAASGNPAEMERIDPENDAEILSADEVPTLDDLEFPDEAESEPEEAGGGPDT
jgi:hypothetical protein